MVFDEFDGTMCVVLDVVVIITWWSIWKICSPKYCAFDTVWEVVFCSSCYWDELSGIGFVKWSLQMSRCDVGVRPSTD
jgi:hypothetical protein